MNKETGPGKTTVLPEFNSHRLNDAIRLSRQSTDHQFKALAAATTAGAVAIAGCAVAGPLGAIGSIPFWIESGRQTYLQLTTRKTFLGMFD